MSDNPFAFPFPDVRDQEGCGITEGSNGMTLRDYFAAHALAGAMASHGSYGIGNGPGDIAARVYEIADLSRRYGVIAVEALNVKNMTRAAKGTADTPGTNVAAKAGLNRSINDASWGRLKELLRYKTALNGGRLIEVNPRGTSQACSGCGVVVAKTLRDRWHDCPDCGLSIDRDHNAAINVLHRAVVGPGLDKPLIAVAGDMKIAAFAAETLPKPACISGIGSNKDILS